MGIVKGVILGIEPRSTFVDLTHGIAAQDVWQGAFALAAAAPWFPRGTIHLAVVDPGVGTERSAVVVQTDRALYLAPDNGLLTLALEVVPAMAAWRLDRPEFFLPRVGRTFHGRDVFAPVAATLATGRPPDALGTPMDPADLVRLPIPPVHEEGDGRTASVLHVDHFGNLVTGFRPEHLVGRKVRAVEAGGCTLPLGRVYQDVPRDEILALWGSFDYLEIAQNQGNAARTLGLGKGDPVRVVLEPR